jgi:PIN domain nuclease of toxin-antitoxin system
MAKYLLDTHVLLWMTKQPENIPVLAKSILESENRLLVSHICIWEMAIKIKTQKLNVAIDLPDFITSSIKNYSLELLPISLQHIYFTQQLHLHHRDPFDKLLIAQSLSEDIPINTSDEAFDAYGIKRIWR